MSQPFSYLLKEKGRMRGLIFALSVLVCMCLSVCFFCLSVRLSVSLSVVLDGNCGLRGTFWAAQQIKFLTQ